MYGSRLLQGLSAKHMWSNHNKWSNSNKVNDEGVPRCYVTMQIGITQWEETKVTSMQCSAMQCSAMLFAAT